jgi:predicted transcriptional regulator
MVRISVELPDDVAEALAKAASERQSSREAVVVDAVQRLLAERDDGLDAFVADRDAFAAFLAEGEADIEAGRTVSFEEAVADIDAIIARARAART